MEPSGISQNNPWNTPELHGTSWNCHGIAIELHGTSTEHHETSTELHGTPWNIKEFPLFLK
jgi:hypothetical protein